MNTATKNLENDHVYILRLIDVMERMVLNNATNIAHLEMVVNLIQQYADNFHHTKEDHLLFPLLVKKGFSNEVGPVAVMLNDHAVGRNFIKSMVAEIADFKNGVESVLPEIYRNMLGYIDLLRSHIAKENNVLFRMADHMISVEDQEMLLQQFDEVELKDFGKQKIQGFITDIEDLEVVYNI
jgi:hemerythrin-like domain-containing protein